MSQSLKRKFKNGSIVSYRYPYDREDRWSVLSKVPKDAKTFHITYDRMVKDTKALKYLIQPYSSYEYWGPTLGTPGSVTKEFKLPADFLL